MQRWMLWTALGIAGLAVMILVVMWIAKREIQLHQPAKIWIPIPLRADLPMEDQKKIAEQIKEQLSSDEILRAVVKDVGLQAEFKQTSESSAVKELKRRLFVEVGSTDTPLGSMPSINIGVSGIGREKEILEDTSERIICDVWNIIGIDPKTGKPINPGNAPLPDKF